MADKIAIPLFLFAMSAILTSIWYRLGIVEELKQEFRSFKDTAYKTFKSKEECELERKACHHD